MPSLWASHLLSIDSFVWLANKVIIITPEKRNGFSNAKPGWECKCQEAHRTPMKPQLDFKVDILVRNNVNIAACPVQGMSLDRAPLLEQWAADRQMTNNCAMPCISKIKPPVCHITFWCGSRKLAKFFQRWSGILCVSFRTSAASNTFLGLFFRVSTWDFLKTGLFSKF